MAYEVIKSTDTTVAGGRPREGISGPSNTANVFISYSPLVAQCTAISTVYLFTQKKNKDGSGYGYSIFFFFDDCLITVL